MVRREERVEHRDEAVEGEGPSEEALVLDDDVEELPEDDERVVVGLGAEEVCGPERLLENRVGEVREACDGRALVELLEERRGVGRGVGEALTEVPRGELREAVDVADVGDGLLVRLDGEMDEHGAAEEEREEELADRDEEVEPGDVRRGEECFKGVALLGEDAVEAVEREHPRDVVQRSTEKRGQHCRGTPHGSWKR